MQRSLITGSMPGIAASTSDTWVLGSAPNTVGAPENSLASEITWAWTSSPSTTSHSPVSPLMSDINGKYAVASPPIKTFQGVKMPTLRRRSVLVGAVATILAAPAVVRAQNVGDWPKGPVKIIVPFPPGGSTDPVARIIQAKLIDNAGWNVVVDNKPGGTGAVGSAVAAKSPPDGQTWMITFDSHILNPAFAPGLPYKDSDLFNVMQIGRTPQAIGAHPDRPYKTF